MLALLPQVCALSDVSKKMKHDETCDFSDHLSSSFFVPIKMSETLTCGPAPSVGSGDCEPKIMQSLTRHFASLVGKEDI